MAQDCFCGNAGLMIFAPGRRRGRQCMVGAVLNAGMGGRASLAIVKGTSPMPPSKRYGKYRPVLRRILSPAVEMLMLSCRTDCISSPLTTFMPTSQEARVQRVPMDPITRLQHPGPHNPSAIPPKTTSLPGAIRYPASSHRSRRLRPDDFKLTNVLVYDHSLASTTRERHS